MGFKVRKHFDEQCQHLPAIEPDEAYLGLRWLGWIVVSIMEGDLEIDARDDDEDFDHPRCAKLAHGAIHKMTDYIRNAHNELHKRDDRIAKLERTLATAERTVETLQAMVDLLPKPEGVN